MADTTTRRSNEENHVPDPHAVEIASGKDEIEHIARHYNEDMVEGMDAGDVKRRHDLVDQWYDWCNREYGYPGINAMDWEDMARAAGDDVDIRLLIRGHSYAGYSLLLFLEACYAVDKALCGTDMEAFEKVKVWHMPQEMKAYKYLMSDEMRHWWILELEELEKETRSSSSSRVSLSYRIGELEKCLARLETVLESGEGIWTDIWTTMGEVNGTVPPAGLDDAIGNRVTNLRTSVEVLRKALQRSEQEDVTSSRIAPVSYTSPESGGIRRRIPRAASESVNGHESGFVQSPTSNDENITVPLDVTSSNQVDPQHRPGRPTVSPQYLQSMISLGMSRLKTFMTRCKTSSVMKWFGSGETACTITICAVVTSAGFLVKSVLLANAQSASSSSSSSEQSSSAPDPNFFGNVSQSILSILSIYLLIATTIQTQSVCLYYRSWFWLWLCASVLFSVLGLSLYYPIPMASTILLWAAAFAQVVIPLLLVIKTGAVEAKNWDDVERHRD